MSDAARSAPVPFLKATLSVARLALRATVRTRRSLFMLALFGLPVLIALAQRLSAQGRAAGIDLYGLLVARYYLGIFDGAVIPLKALPLAALFYAAALVGDEVLDRTLVYYICRPIPRAALIVGKFAAYLVWTMALTLLSLGLVFLLAHTPEGMTAADAARRLARDLALALATLGAYGGLFALAGVLLRRTLLPGLAFLYPWELGARLAGPLSHATLSAHVEALLQRAAPPSALSGLARPTGISSTEAVLVLGLVAVLGVVAAGAVFAQREYVPDR